METIVTAKVEVDFKEGKRTIEMILKKSHEIEDCEVGKVVMLNIGNGDTYTGIFGGVNDGDVTLRSLSSNWAIDISLTSFNDYFEEVRNELNKM